MNDRTTHDDDISITDTPDSCRFEITVAGKLAGYAAYRLHPGRLVLTHTEIDDAYQGQGLAGSLASGALDSARIRGLQVTPSCRTSPATSASIRSTSN